MAWHLVPFLPMRNNMHSTLAVLQKSQSHLAVRSSRKAAHSKRRAVFGWHAGGLQLAKLGLSQCLHAKASCLGSCIGDALCTTGNRQSTEYDYEQCIILQHTAVVFHLSDDSMHWVKGNSTWPAVLLTGISVSHVSLPCCPTMMDKASSQNWQWPLRSCACTFKT